MSGVPLVIVERVWREPGHRARIGADVRVGGHPGRVVLDFAEVPQMAVYVELSRFLGMHPASTKAVIQVLERFERGEAIAPPIDLSDEIRRAPGPPSPFEQLSEARRAELEAAADLAGVTVESAALDPANSARVIATLRIDGQLHRFVAEIHDDEGTVPVVSTLEGPKLGEPTRERRYAISRALRRARRGLL